MENAPQIPEGLRDHLLSFYDLRTLEDEVATHGGLLEFYNECHLPAGPGGGQFGPKGACPGTGGPNLARDSDGLVGKISAEEAAANPAPRGKRGASLRDPHEGTIEVDGVRGYVDSKDPSKRKPVPGTDAWLEAHNIDRKIFEGRPYVKFEPEENDPAFYEAYKDLKLQPDARGKLQNKGLNYWYNNGSDRTKQSEGGYLMYKTQAPGSPDGPIPAQARPNVGVVSDKGEQGRKLGILQKTQRDLDGLKKTTPAQYVKMKKEQVKQAEQRLEQVKKATPESIRTQAKKDLDLAKDTLAKAKASGDEAAILEAKDGLKKEALRYKKQQLRAARWNDSRQYIETKQAENRLENAKKSAENAVKDPKQHLANAIKNQEGIVERAENAYKKTSNKYIFPKGEKVARIDVGGDPQNIKNLEGKGRLYFAMEGAIKHDAVLTAIKKEDPTAAVVNVPSVTLWQQNKKDDAAGSDEEVDIDAVSELTWFTKKYGRGREIILIPDADGVINPSVMDQAKNMEAALKNGGAKDVYVAAPPLRRIGSKGDKPIEKFKLPSGASEERKGVDDHLGAGRGTLGQLTYEKSAYVPDHDLSHLAKQNGGPFNKNAIEGMEKALNAISTIVGARGSARITKKSLANAAQLKSTSAYEARLRLEEAGIIRVENLFDEDLLKRGIKEKNTKMSDERYNELIKNKVVKAINFEDPEYKADPDQSSIYTIVDNKYLSKDSDISRGTLQELPTWKPPKSFKGWTSSVTGKPDTTGLAKSVQETSLKNSAVNQKRLARKKPTHRVQAIELPGVRYVRSPAGAKLYGVPIGAPIPEGGKLKLESDGIISMTMGSMDLSSRVEVVEPGLLSFYNKCHDEDDGKFCEGDDGPTSLKTDPSWPKRKGRKVTSRPGEDGDEVKAERVYETETANGAKIRLYDKTGKVKGEKAEQFLNNHARMHEMYPMSPPRSIVVDKPRLFGRSEFDDNNKDVSLVHALKPHTYINANNINYDTKDFREGWGMHSAQTGNTKNFDYILTHEYGHHVDFARNSDGYTHRPNPIFSNNAMRGTLSRYGRENDMEAYAETFAEWHHTDGRTRNPVTIAMARDQGWYGSNRRASGEMEQEHPSLLSFQVEEVEELPEEGISVIDNWEDGPTVINYKAKKPSPEEIEAAEKLAREVFEELGLDYDKEGDNE